MDKNRLVRWPFLLLYGDVHSMNVFLCTMMGYLVEDLDCIMVLREDLVWKRRVLGVVYVKIRILGRYSVLCIFHVCFSSNGRFSLFSAFLFI